MDTGSAPKGPSSPTKVSAPSGGEPRWHSRGYLPHLDQAGLTQAITFRLHDALPQSKMKGWRDELGLSSRLPEERERELRRRIEKYLDVGHGSCWLKDLQIGRLVEEELLHFDGERYQLLAWCIMPNHVHVLIEPNAGWDLEKIVQAWNGRTALPANRLLGRTGSFWQREYFDRFVRDDAHLENALRYIDENPVKAGLARNAKDWPLSSARFAGSADFSRRVLSRTSHEPTKSEAS
jgi:REP element-mobilizing transposase RayT